MTRVNDLFLLHWLKNNLLKNNWRNKKLLTNNWLFINCEISNDINDYQNQPFSDIGRANWDLPLPGLADHSLLWKNYYLFEPKPFRADHDLLWKKYYPFKPIIIKPVSADHDLLCIFINLKCFQHRPHLAGISITFYHFTWLACLEQQRSHLWCRVFHLISLFSVCVWTRHISLSDW